jgi:Ca2+/Na+ antiporter
MEDQTTTGNPQDAGDVQTQTEKPVETSPTETTHAGNQRAEKPGNIASGQPLSAKCFEELVPNYALVFFDHIYSEYLALKSSIKDPEVTLSLDAIHGKRLDCKLSWADIYTFDLKLVQARPPASLIRKAYDARQRYRSIAGQKEYDEYIASNPPNLIEIKVAPNADPPEPDVIIETALRADLEYLLSKFFLYYATLPSRERLRDELTRRAVLLTLGGVVVLVGLIFVNLGIVRIFNVSNSTAGLTLITVALAGIMGGCVSMLQRIQSAPTEGDALFNLASLNNGWIGLSLSPLYGGIFASLLFVLFAAGLLKGSAFPEIHTPSELVSSAERSAPSATPLPTATPTISPRPSATLPASPSPGAAINTSVPSPATTSSPAAGSSVSEPEKPQTTQTSESTPQILRIKQFLEETGPVDGVAYALLILWSFLAGFAERLVPDTLNRLVAKNQAIQGGSS